jgi:hypothetical protein
MDPAYVNPIMPVLPDLGPALVVPAVLAALGGCVGLGALLFLVIRGEPGGSETILDVGAPTVVDPTVPSMARRSGRRSFVHWVRREINVREIRVGPALRR